jgi:hypothetical protein
MGYVKKEDNGLIKRRVEGGAERRQWPNPAGKARKNRAGLVLVFWKDRNRLHLQGRRLLTRRK